MPSVSMYLFNEHINIAEKSYFRVHTQNSNDLDNRELAAFDLTSHFGVDKISQRLWNITQ